MENTQNIKSVITKFAKLPGIAKKKKIFLEVNKKHHTFVTL